MRGIASSAIDVSDGLLGDLGHILKQSAVGARIDTEIAAGLMGAAAASLDVDLRIEYVLAGGDDYELLFTAPPGRRDAVLAAARAAGTPVTRIGRIEAETGLRLVDGAGRPVDRRYASFDHFA